MLPIFVAGHMKLVYCLCTTNFRDSNWRKSHIRAMAKLPYNKPRSKMLAFRPGLIPTLLNCLSG